MDYLWEIVSKSFWDAWKLVFERSVPTAMIGLSIYWASFFWLKYRRRNEEAKQRAKDFLQPAAITAICFVVFWILYAVFFTPKRLLSEARSSKPVISVQPIPQPTPFKFDVDVMDSKSRNEIKRLRDDLGTANKTIRHQQAELDPLGKPIASAKFSVLINFQSQKEKASHYIGGGAGVVLAKGTNALLEAGTGEHFSDGDGHSRFLMDCAFDTPYMGKPIRALAETEYVQLYFRVLLHR